MPLSGVGEKCGALSGPPYFIGCVAGYACTAGENDASQAESTCQPFIAGGNACNPADFLYEDQKCASGVCYQQRCQQHGPAECSAPDVPP
jgi:hypothetical protein